jgi:hypothetical protein
MTFRQILINTWTSMSFFCFLMIAVCFVVSQVIMHLFLFRIQMDAIDPEKLKATLGDEQLQDTCDMKNAMEMVALLEAQLKDLSPNLDSIAEYVIMRYLGTKHIFLSVIFLSWLNQVPHKSSFVQ